MQALQIIRTQPIDLLFLDLNMSELNGMELLCTLQSEGRTLKIAVCSADFQDETQKRVCSYGANTFINKNQLRDQLPSVLSNLGVM